MHIQPFMKINFTFAAFFFIGTSVLSQETQESKSTKVFHAVGYTILADYVSSPLKVIPMTVHTNAGDIESHTFMKSDAINLMTYMYRFRYNFSEPSAESAFSFSINPSLSFGLVIPNKGDNGGFFTFNVPLLLNYEHGAGSTYNSTLNHGFTIGAGIEFYKSPLFFIEKTGEIPITAFIMPTVSAGYRHWTRSNHLAEFNFKIGKGSKVKLPEIYEEEELPGSLSAYEFRFSIIRFLNY